MISKIQKKQLAILSILKESDKPLSSIKIAEDLSSQGIEISQRTIRLYLQKMDKSDLTTNIGKKGRIITAKGMDEINATTILRRVGFLSAKIDQMTFGMDFDLSSRAGTVVVNITLVSPDVFLKHIKQISKVFKYKYAMGLLTTLLAPGSKFGNYTIPDDKIGFGTVCSITLNGVLLKHGIPTHSRFGGLLELKNKKITRFLEIINYDGTSIDPLEIFIRSGMTDYIGAITKGTGKIGASFREIPSQSRSLVLDLAKKLDIIGLGGFVKIGHGGQPLLGIPVNEGRSGAIVIGGLNPVAILEESGVRVQSKALAGFIEFNKMFNYQELESRLKQII